ncbi:MAG TPA: hypothetical protein VFE53_02685, partial [Mucilaginibacter sp.]|nr:hypothetical protein [Mucilaginibacter sp.]
VKLGKLSVDPNSSTLVPQSQKTKYAAAKKANSESGSSYAGFSDRLSINLALNLADVSSNVTFNKSINGGIGLGYFVTDNLQLALFYDVSQLSQLRDYVVNAYQGKPIPNGTGTYYNSISTTDSNLFYNKTVSGLSFKLIFSIGNQKAPAAAPGG